MFACCAAVVFAGEFDVIERAVELGDVVHFAQGAVAARIIAVNGQVGGEQLGMGGVGKPVGKQVFGVFAQRIAVTV